MFEKKAELSVLIEEAGLAEYATFMEALCMPSLAFEARGDAGGAPRTGASRLGGRPDLPPSIDWPVRPAYANAKSLAASLARRGPELTDAFQEPMPLDFICQLDLEEVAKTRALGDRLPGHGRLLFFWDSNCGAWIESAQSCRVVWDASPRSALAPREAPMPAPRSFPVTPVGFLPIWTIPDRLLLMELAQDDEDLRAILEADDYEEVWGEIMDRGPGVLASGREVLSHRLGGWPMPEQGDPRFDAAASARGVLSLFDRSPTPEERTACAADMHDWTLLLEIGLVDLWSPFGEGTVYFVMREADLKARNFERVHAIYQQT